MKILVTGSAGHLGEALVRTLHATGARRRRPRHHCVAVHARRRLDRRSRRRRRVPCAASTPCCTPRRCTSRTSRRTARQEFVDTNVTGTLTLLEAAVASGRARVRVHQHHQRVRRRADAGRRASPRRGSPRTSAPIPKNIYGVTKTAAEDLCALFHRDHALPCLSCARRGSSPKTTTTRRPRGAYDDAEPQGRTSSCIGASISRTS